MKAHARLKMTLNGRGKRQPKSEPLGTTLPPPHLSPPTELAMEEDGDHRGASRPPHPTQLAQKVADPGCLTTTMSVTSQTRSRDRHRAGLKLL